MECSRKHFAIINKTFHGVECSTAIMSRLQSRKCRVKFKAIKTAHDDKVVS